MLHILVLLLSMVSISQVMSTSCVGPVAGVSPVDDVRKDDCTADGSMLLASATSGGTIFIATVLEDVSNWYATTSLIRAQGFDGSCVIVAGTPDAVGAPYYRVPLPCTNTIGPDCLQWPTALLALPDGDVLVADSGNHRVVRLLAATGGMAPFAGEFIYQGSDGLGGYAGDGDLAINARLNWPYALALEAAGSVLVLDSLNGYVRRVSMSTGIISTIAGSGPSCTLSSTGETVSLPSTACFQVSLSGSWLTSYFISLPSGAMGIATWPNGDFAVADTLSNRIVRFNATQTKPASFVFSTIVNAPSDKVYCSPYDPLCFCPNEGAENTDEGKMAIDACIWNPRSLAVLPSGGLLVSDVLFYNFSMYNRVRLVDPLGGSIRTLIGNNTYSRSYYDPFSVGITAGTPFVTSRDESDAFTLAMGFDGTLLLFSPVNSSYASTSLYEFARSVSERFCGDGGPALSACLNTPTSLAFVNSVLYIADTSNHRVRAVFPSGDISTVAGSGVALVQVGWEPSCPAEKVGDGGLATLACLNNPTSVSASQTSLFIVDSGNEAVRLVDVSGVISTILNKALLLALLSQPSYDLSIAATAILSGDVKYIPKSVAYNDHDGFLYVADNIGVYGVALTNNKATTLFFIAAEGSPVTVPIGYVPPTDPYYDYGAPPTTLTNVLNIAVCTGFATPINDVVIGYASPVKNGNDNTILIIDYNGNVYSSSVSSPNIVTLIATSNMVGWANFATCNAKGNAIVTSWNGGIYDIPAGSMVYYYVPAEGMVPVSYTYYYSRTTVWTGRASGDGGEPQFASFQYPQGIVIDASTGNLYIADYQVNLVRVIIDASLPTSSYSCRTGFSCKCAVPTPCISKATWCGANTVKPKAVLSGFSAISDAAGHSVGVEPCPAGAYCYNGTRTQCPPGTIGSVFTRQIKASECTLCPQSTFSGSLGAVSGACRPCPKSTFTTSSGSYFCSWTPWNESTCKTNEFSLPGPWGACLLKKDGDFLQGQTIVSAQFPPTTNTHTEGGGSVDLQIKIATPIAFILGMPCILAVLFYALSKCGCLRGAPQHFSARILFPILRAVDQMGEWNSSGTGKPRTEVGGACSSAAAAFIFAFTACISISFRGPENIIGMSSVLPSRVSSLEQVSKLPFFAISPPLEALPSLTAGVVVQVALMGTACGSATIGASFLSGGEFKHAVAATDSAAALFTHTFSCTDCTFGSASQLLVTFPGSCQSMAILIAGAGAQGAATAFAMIAEPSRGSYLSTASVSITPALEIVQNAVTNAKFRGFLLTAGPLSMMTVAEPPVSTTLTVFLTGASTFSKAVISYKFIWLDLVYQLLAVFALGVFFNVVYL